MRSVLRWMRAFLPAQRFGGMHVPAAMPDLTIVTFAVPQESSDFRQAIHDDENVVVVHTGIGTAAARRSVERALAGHRPRRLISAGFAGALDPALAIGDVVLAENYSDRAIVKSVTTPCRRGALLTVGNAVETVAEKARLRAETGAMAVDMETSAIAAICVERGLPMLSLRAISDAADAVLPIPFAVSWDLETQRPRTFAIAIYLLRHPEIVGIFRSFIAGLARARRALSRSLVSVLGEPPSTGKSA